MMRTYDSFLYAATKSLLYAEPLAGLVNRAFHAPMRVATVLARNLYRGLSVTLIISLLATSAPAAPQTIVSVAKEARVNLIFWLHANDLPRKILRALSGQGPEHKPQEKQEDRDARVSRIQIYPGDVTISLAEQVTFAAVAYDPDGVPVAGLNFKWTAQDTTRSRRTHITARGDFEPRAPGAYRIVAEALGLTAEATVMVLPGPRKPRPTDPPIRVRPVSTRDLPSPVSTTTKKARAADPKLISQSESISRRANKRSKLAHRSAPAKGKTGRTRAMVVPIAPEDGWNNGNYPSADDPSNSRGDPPSAAMDGGAGSRNFKFVAPVLALPGRGIDISLGLAYNSRLWNKSGSQMNYDIDRDWPAPGWSLGFGKVLSMGINGGAMIVDADGTRHAFAGTINNFGSSSHYTLHTTDGTFIDYTGWVWNNGASTSATAKFPDGTIIDYNVLGEGAGYPTRITDRNGNFITITYVGNTGPRIQTITDTLGRLITFSYNANNLLTSITAPGLGGGTRTLVRLRYRQLSLNYSFASPQIQNVVVRNSSPWVIDAIYYPGTGTGYWFDANAYSTYGMLKKVSERRGMTFSEPETFTEGQVTREDVYNYPLNPSDTSGTAGSNLTDAPAYTTQVETWTRDGVVTDSATTSYEVNESSSPRTVTVTLPNGTKSKQFLHNSPGSFLDGLVFEDQTLDSNNVVLQSSLVTWVQGAYESPRPSRVEARNENQQVTATEFTYGTVYNQVTDVRNLDYDGTLLRSTKTLYQNSSNYTNRHIFNLPLKVEIFAGDNATRVAQTDYQYDGQTLTNRPDVVQHDHAFDPYSEQNGFCSWQPDLSDPDCTPGSCPDICCCDGHCTENFVCPYLQTTDYRGNVTQITTYSNAGANPAAGAIIETRRYDIAGSLVKTGSSCCEETSFNYTNATQYAYPLSQNRGSATDQYKQITTSATYDFNTGLMLSATDANGRISQTSYFGESLRPQTSSSASGAHTDFAYEDVAMSVTETTYLESHPTHTTIADQNVKLLNGRGQVRQEKALGAGSVFDLVDTEYDSMGRVFRKTRPYRSGDTLQWSNFAYDALGRTTRITEADGSINETYYNERDFDTGDSYTPVRPNVVSQTAPGETTLVRDAWGRERWGRTDAQGRLVEVVEPNPSGNGSTATSGLITTYSYDTLGNLTGVAQGPQTRSFKYDSLSRLTAQKLAETSATLNDAGTYVGSGTWSEVFTYDEHSNLTSCIDARGVKTVYSYNSDPLNRLQSLSWDTSGFGDTANPILAAATITYQYRTKGSPTDLKDITQLSSVTTAGISTDSYSYDSEGRIGSNTLTLTSRPSHPFVTDYIYDELDRIKDVRYPAEYGNGTQPRKLVHHDYDVASRLIGLTVDSQSHASQIVYNAASQTTSLRVGLAGSNQIIESYGYEPATGLLSSQKIARDSAPTNYLLDLAYDYAGSNGKRTGQLKKILNNLNHNKDRAYNYDALGRLIQATGGPAAAPIWTQTYSYDRYGNRTSVSASGFSAKSASKPNSHLAKSGRQFEIRNSQSEIVAPPDPKAVLPTDQLAARSEINLLDALRTDIPHSISDSSLNTGSRPEPANALPVSAPQGPPVFTDDPLVAGVTVIKAVHITELRTAVNQARARAGLAAASWAEAVSSGVAIKASHIVELRARLDEARAALGLSPASYTDPSLSAGITIKAPHIQELRQRVTEALGSMPMTPDGHTSLSYDATTNRINTAGWGYDAAGNQTRVHKGGGVWQRFQYDAANRLVRIKADDDITVLASYTYGDSNERLILEEGGVRTYYACAGKVEYTESGGSTTPQWSKSYIYLDARLLSTLTPNGSGGEAIQYHHPDRLGTRLVTNAQNTTSFEQVTLPFGTALNAESTGSTNRRFTSYDRNANTGLDYAINRHYDPQQGRFTQVDPIAMDSYNLGEPQTLNLYTYCANDPINAVDPHGLFFKKLWRAIKKIFTNKWFRIAVGIALLVISQGWLGPLTKTFFTIKLGGFFGVTQVTQYTTLGIINAVLKGITIATELMTWSWKAVFQRGLNLVIGAGVGTILGGLGGSLGPGGTPEWNPDNNSFRQARRVRRSQPAVNRGVPWRQGLVHVGGVWRVGGGHGRPSPVGYSSRYPRDIKGGTYREAFFRSEAEARFEAFRKLGPLSVEVEHGKWRSFDGRWQYRAKPGDVGQNHVHLEYLNPATGQVLVNWHFRFPPGTRR